MENVRRLIKFIVICLVSICLADDSLCEKVCGEDSLSANSLSVFPECPDISFSATVLQCNAPRSTSSANSLRTSFQNQRQNSNNSTRTGFTMVKAGKSMNEYSTSLFRRSIINFPSGMNGGGHRLISLGKLII